MMLGFGLAAIGMDTVSGELRMTFGWSELLRGVDFLVVVIGLFGLGEILITMEEGLAFEGKNAKINAKVVLADLEAAAQVLADADPQLGRSAAGWASRPAAPPPPRSWATASPSAFRPTATSSAPASSKA